jgi:predicted Zn-dependent protease
MSRHFRLLAAALIALQVPPVYPQANLPDLGDSAQAELTPQMERRVGEQVMREIRRDPDYISDPEIANYIQSVGQRLVAVSPEARQEFEFFVVRDPQINAFAMPGGYIGVNSGLIVGASSESEMASVLAHEVAHVTQRHLARQLEKQSQVSVLSMVGLVLGLIAARSSPGAASAAITGASAIPAATFLSYSRDFEREADRVGFQILQQSGYDVFAMPTFFERLQQNSRLYDNNAPAYLRTHPVTSERIADMQGRVHNLPFKQTPDSPEFPLVRAKLRAEQGRPDDAVAYFREVLREKRFGNENAARYGYAVALVRAKDYRAAESEIATIRKSGAANPMIINLAARARAESGDAAAARAIIEAALPQYPDNLALRYTYAEILQQQGQNNDALSVLDRLVRDRPKDFNLFKMQAKSYAALGNRFGQHRALAEAYYLQGSLPAAIEQLEFARASGQGDFYSLSAVDARVRELKREQTEEMKEKREGRFLAGER